MVPRSSATTDYQCTLRRRRTGEVRPRKRREASNGTSINYLIIQPIRQLHQKNVARRNAEDVVNVPPEAESDRHRVVLARLLPDDEQRRTGLVFPAENVRCPERLHVEIGVAGVRVWRETLTKLLAARVGELDELAVAAT